MNRITITVSGSTGTGKSSVAQLIGRFLRNEYYMNVDIKDDPYDDSDSWDSTQLFDRLVLIAKQTEVVVVTQPTLRSSPDER
jgi:uridine kinase